MSSDVIYRRQYLVNRPYQVRFIVEILLVVALAVGLCTFGTYVLVIGELDSGFQSSEARLLNMREAFPMILLVSALITFIAMAFVGGFITLRESHRVVGPEKKLREKFREMTEGNYNYMIPLRKNDVFKGMDESINAHLNALRDFFANFERTMGEITPLLVSIEQDHGKREDNLQAIRGFVADLNQWAETLNSS